MKENTFIMLQRIFVSTF